jgi:multimeric flavodoxin WrbA
VKQATVLVLYYSRGGRTAALARQAARGVESAGAVARLRTVPPVVAATTGDLPPVPADGPPYVELAELADADGLLLGSPTRFGNMAAPLKHFLDSTSDLAVRASGQAGRRVREHVGRRQRASCSAYSCRCCITAC